MDELGFFQWITEKGLAEKSRRYKEAKKSKQCLTTVFFVAVDVSEISEPFVI